MAHEELPPISITPGAIRFNTDSMKLEYFRIGTEAEGTASYAGIGTLAAGEWVQLTTDTPDIQTGGTRGILAGGYAGSGPNDTIDYVNVDTTGDALDFGNLNSEGHGYCLAGTASRTRAVFFGGRDDPTPASSFNVIQYLTISSTGDSIDFGDITGRNAYFMQAGGDSTRGITSGGMTSPGNVMSNDIQYITIAATGNSIEFGDLTQTQSSGGSFSSPTRMIVVGGRSTPSSSTNVIQFVTTSTLGNATDFGDTLESGLNRSGSSNSVRGVYGGWGQSPQSNSIEYITMATLGNGTDFGDLTIAKGSRESVSSPTRAVFAGGSDPNVDVIDYVQIMSTGNALDFGDMQSARENPGGASNGHGGLG